MAEDFVQMWRRAQEDRRFALQALGTALGALVALVLVGVSLVALVATVGVYS